jgi:hypothetical protein
MIETAGIVRFGAIFVPLNIVVKFKRAGFKNSWYVDRPCTMCNLSKVELLVGKAINHKWPMVMNACEQLHPTCVVAVSAEAEVDKVLESLECEGFLSFDWPLSTGMHWVVGHIRESIQMPFELSLPATDRDQDVTNWLAHRIFRWFQA